MNVNNRWQKLLIKMENQFGQKPEYDSILFVIGLQELGFIPKKLTKNQKLDVLHVAICSLLSTYGYYAFKGKDEDGWPQFERIESLPFLAPIQQEQLIKEAILDYFEIE
jgi:hypothetical protein